jgi:hypothetical protein
VITGNRNGYIAEYSSFPLQHSSTFFAGEDLFHTLVMVGSLVVLLNVSTVPSCGASKGNKFFPNQPVIQLALKHIPAANTTNFVRFFRRPARSR